MLSLIAARQSLNCQGANGPTTRANPQRCLDTPVHVMNSGLNNVSWRMQALFRKIAAALPGMESLSAAKTEDLVDVNLSATASQNRAGSATNASGCAC